MVISHFGVRATVRPLPSPAAYPCAGPAALMRPPGLRTHCIPVSGVLPFHRSDVASELTQVLFKLLADHVPLRRRGKVTQRVV